MRSIETIGQDVNRLILNHFIHGCQLTDEKIINIFAVYEDEEYAIFCILWNKRVKLISQGLRNLN